jgi:hypothetical protein
MDRVWVFTNEGDAFDAREVTAVAWHGEVGDIIDVLISGQWLTVEWGVGWLERPERVRDWWQRIQDALAAASPDPVSLYSHPDRMGRP